MRHRKCSKGQLASLMEVEAPYPNKLKDEGGMSAISGDLQNNIYMIAFVDEKIEELLLLEESGGKRTLPANRGDPKNFEIQVTGPWPGKLVPIMALEDALNPIEIMK